MKLVRFYIVSGSRGPRRSAGEVVGRGEGVGMIGTQHVVEAGEGVAPNLAGPLMFPQATAGPCRGTWMRAVCRCGPRERLAASGEGVVCQLSGLLMITQRPQSQDEGLR